MNMRSVCSSFSSSFRSSPRRRRVALSADESPATRDITVSSRAILARKAVNSPCSFGKSSWDIVRSRQCQSAANTTAINAAAGTTMGGTNHSARTKAFAMFTPDVKEARFDPGF